MRYRQAWIKATAQSRWHHMVVKDQHEQAAEFWRDGTACQPFDLDELRRTAYAVDSYSEQVFAEPPEKIW